MDLFGHVMRSPTAAQELRLETAARPRARDPKRDPRPYRGPDATPTIDPDLRALYVAPDGETEEQRAVRLKARQREKSQFRSRAKRDGRELHRKAARAIPIGVGWREMVAYNGPIMADEEGGA